MWVQNRNILKQLVFGPPIVSISILHFGGHTNKPSRTKRNRRQLSQHGILPEENEVQINRWFGFHDCDWYRISFRRTPGHNVWVHYKLRRWFPGRGRWTRVGVGCGVTVRFHSVLAWISSKSHYTLESLRNRTSSRRCCRTSTQEYILSLGNTKSSLQLIWHCRKARLEDLKHLFKGTTR